MEDCYVRVTHNFEGSGPEELHVEEGDVIKVIQYLSNHWLDAERHGNSGLVPVKYTKKIEGDPEPKVTPSSSSNAKTQRNNCEQGDFSSKPEGSGIQMQALFDFQARNSTELSFSAGSSIVITADVDDVWFEGTCGGKTGLFPKSYVTAKEPTTTREELKSKPYAQAIYPFIGESDSELTFREGQIIFLHQRSGSQWMIGELDGKTGLFPTSFVNIKLDLPIEGNQITNAGNFAEKTATKEKVHWREGMEAIVLYPFTALYAEDLELKKGDLLTVLSVVDDIWIRGQLPDGQAGMCPSAYLKPVPSDKPVTAAQSSIKQGQDEEGDVSGVKGNSVDEGHSKLGNVSSPADIPIASRVLKPVCAVSPTKRTVMPSGPKPALKPKPILGHPKRANSLSARPTAPKTPEQSRTRQSFSLNRRSDRAESPAGVFGFSFNGEGEKESVSTPKSLSSKASLLDVTPERNANLPSPLSPLSPFSPPSPSSPGGTRRLAPPRRKAPPPPKVKNRSDGSKSDASSMALGNSGAEKVTSDTAAVSDEVAGQVDPVSPKQQAMVLPNSHKKNKAWGSPAQQRRAGQEMDSPAALSTDKLKLASPVKEPCTPPQERRLSPTKARPVSVQYMGGQSVNQSNKRLSGSLEDLQMDETDESKDSGSRRSSIMTPDSPIPPSEVPELEQLDRDIAKAEDHLQKEEKVFSGMKTIMQLVMTDPSKQSELSYKVSRSQKKLEEWKEELKNLKARRRFLIKSYYAKKFREDLTALEMDLERQIQNKESLETLLSVVGASRRHEVQANLTTCLETIQEITGKMTDLKVLAEFGSPENSEASSHQRRAEQRQKVVREIISTEWAYQRDLQLCVEYFLTALKRYKAASQVDCDSLFGNIEAVLAASLKLLPSMERAVEGKEAKDQELGKCFVDISEELKLVYATYCRNHDEAIALMEKYEEFPEVQAAFSRCLERVREHTKCWDLSSFLIKPVQRVLKYPLLLSELLKYTPEIHQDKENLIRAVAAMTDVANAINEFKRRKDLVVKYKRVEESGLGTMMQKLNWHSVVKKSSRFNQRITQFTGLVSQTVDERFNEDEKRIRSLEKAIKAFVKDVTSYLDDFRAASLSQFAMGDNITSYYQEAATCTQVAMYITAHQRIGDHMLFGFENRIHQLVLRPLTDLISLFQGPQRLIQKRHDKCLDYDSWTNKIDKIKDREKLKLAKEELVVAKKNYEALNSQLLVDLPEFYQMALSLMKDCVRNFGLAQRKFYAGVLEEYIKLMQSPLIQSTDGDIVEEQVKKTLQVVQKFAELSFIPYSFVSKDSSRKKKKSGKLPLVPSVSSNPPSPKNKKNSDSGSAKLNESGMAGVSLTGAQEPTKTPPQPQPRRKSSSTDLQPELADSSPAEGQLYTVDYDFEAQNTGELTVDKGDIVSVLRCCDSTGNPEWWLVQCGSAAGYVPGTFLIPIEIGQQEDDQEEGEDPEQEVRRAEERADTFASSFPGLYSVEFDFEASSPAELSIHEGQMVSVLKMHDLQGNPEWWYVEEQENHLRGYVPASFLTLEEQII